MTNLINVFYNTFIIILYMYRALYAHHQELNCIDTASAIVTLSQWPSGAPDEHIMLETCRGL